MCGKIENCSFCYITQDIINLEKWLMAYCKTMLMGEYFNNLKGKLFSSSLRVKEGVEGFLSKLSLCCRPDSAEFRTFYRM